jgi:hypothetical protein
MSFESSGTFRRSSAGGPPRSGGTQVFPLPPRAAEKGASGPATGSADTSAVSVNTTVGVGGPPSAPTAQPPRPARRTPPARDVNEPTRIFVVSPEPPAGGDAPAQAELNRRTATFASPPFSPVPALKSVVLAVAKPKLGPAAKASAPPLLRAFDDVRARVTTWATAKTITAPVAEVAQAVADADRKAADARAEKVGAAGPAPPRPSLGLLSRLRRLPTRKLSMLLLAMTVVVSGGSFVGRTVARKRAIASRASVAAAPRPPAEPAQPSAAPPPPPAAPVEVAPVEASHPPPAPAHLAATPDGSAPHEATLARRAVDALLAGDRATALRHYRELSRREPGRRAYREAVRLLALAPSDTPL